LPSVRSSARAEGECDTNFVVSLSRGRLQPHIAEALRQVVGLYGVGANGMRVGSGFTVGMFGAVVGLRWSLGLGRA